MPFANLGPREKEAFFGLLDEYFQSRPEIFGAQGQGQGHNHQGQGLRAPANLGDGTPGSMMKQAMIANPEATVKVFSAGLRHAANAASPPPPSRTTQASGNHDEEDAGPPSSVASRIAALRGGGSGAGAGTGPSSSLTTSQKFGNLDTSSAKGFISSLGRNNKSPPPAASPVPPVLPKPQSSFAPPPTRRVFPQPQTHEPEQVEELAPEPPVAPTPPPPPPGRKAPIQKEEPKGEWAEALYDYDSQEPGDLNIKEGQRVLVTERSSDDWWTGEVNGKSGLFPASYVQLV